MNEDINLRKRVVHLATAKKNHEVDRLARGPQAREKVVYVITREEIESHDILRLLTTFGASNDPEDLRRLRGRVVYTVDGYDDTSESVCEIEEVRRYFRQIDRWWQGWTFFSDLESDCLAMVASCLLPHITVARHAAHATMEITARQEDLITFFENGLPLAAYLHTRAGIDKFAGMKMLQAVSYYLDLPDR